LTLTGIGQRFAGSSALRNAIKRTRRLLGNSKLQCDAMNCYKALRGLLAASPSRLSWSTGRI
jgi:hypothetical protein